MKSFVKEHNTAKELIKLTKEHREGYNTEIYLSCGVSTDLNYNEFIEKMKVIEDKLLTKQHFIIQNGHGKMIADEEGNHFLALNVDVIPCYKMPTFSYTS